MFASVGADGSVRMFDLRHLEHSTIIFEVCKQLTSFTYGLVATVRVRDIVLAVLQAGSWPNVTSLIHNWRRLHLTNGCWMLAQKG